MNVGVSPPEFHITVPSELRAAFGLSYPATFGFALRPHTGPVTADYRHSRGDPWSELPSVDRPFNAVYGTRRDGDVIWVSVGFDPAQFRTDLFVRLRSGGTVISATSLGVANYYDNRQAAVVCTFDDWCDPTHAAFIKTTQLLRQRGMWGSYGVNAGGSLADGWAGLSPSQWAEIQTAVDLGNVELVNHGYQHRSALGYTEQIADQEVIGGAQAITNNVTLPWQSRVGDDQYVLGWLDPYGESSQLLRDRLRAAGIAIQRKSDQQNYSWLPFDDVDGIFERAGNSATFDGGFDRSRFDLALSTGGIFHAYGHPYLDGSADWWHGYNFDLDNPDGNFAQELDHISGYDSVWYAAWGHLYAYRLVALNATIGGSSVEMDGASVRRAGVSRSVVGLRWPVSE
jgi:peptidoglycan/xylan/chitin deacetylase (PgdA/CDA1 family)